MIAGILLNASDGESKGMGINKKDLPCSKSIFSNQKPS
jgi:hypothetical protein